MVIHNVNCINPVFFTKVIILFIFLIGNVYAGQPSWFLLPPINSYEIIGYGQASTLNQAKEMALKDLSEIIKVKVSSSTSVSKELQNGQFNVDVFQNIETSSSSLLIGSVLKHSYESDGVWYAAVSYDTSSIPMKFKRALKGYTLKNDNSSYLTSSNLIKEINQKVGYKLKYILFRENNLWKLQYKDIKLTLSENDFINLFKNNDGNNIALELNQEIYYPHDQMKLFVKVKSAGYISTLYVGSTGKVGVLYANDKIDTSRSYPSQGSEEELIIANPYNKVLHEMYITVWSKEPIDLTAFEEVKYDYLDDSNYKFSNLVKLLDAVDYSSVVIKVKY